MTVLTYAKGAMLALGLAFGSSAVQATTVAFTVDASASSVSITQTTAGRLCVETRCRITASLAPGLDGTSFLLDEGDSMSFDFLQFRGRGTGAATYDVFATLAFSTPSLSVTGGATGFAGLFVGSIVAGVLTWNDLPQTITLADGTEFTVGFEGGLTILNGRRVTTGASVALTSGPNGDPAGGVPPIPLPAGVVLLLTGLGGLAAMRLRRKAA